MSKERTTDSQNLPVKNDEEIAHVQVMRDLQERLKLGISKYGTGLQPFNGRDSAQDEYEEALDKIVYQNCRMREMKEIRRVLLKWVLAKKAYLEDPYKGTNVCNAVSNAEFELQKLAERLGVLNA